MKGQITIFIIIGILILVVIVFAIFSATILKKAAKKPMVEPTKLEAIRNYIEECLALASAESLKLLGEQAGHIWQSQGGVEADPLSQEEGKKYLFFPPTTEKKIPFAIVTYPTFALNDDSGKWFISNNASSKYSAPAVGITKGISVYPWKTFPYNPFTGNITFFGQGLFGWSILPVLEKPYANSIEEALESATLNKTKACTKFNIAFPEFEFASEEPSLKIEFLNNETIFRLNWKINIFDPVVGAKATLEEFIVRQKVRLKKIHEEIKFLIGEEATNSIYNLSAHPAIEIDKITGKGTVVTYTDSNSLLEGKSYKFKFAIQNRAPALWEINQSFLDEISFNPGICDDTNYLAMELQNDKLIFYNATIGNQLIEFYQLKATDPDDDNVSFKMDPNPIEINKISTMGKRIEQLPKIFVSDGIEEDYQYIKIKIEPCTILEY